MLPTQAKISFSFLSFVRSYFNFNCIFIKFGYFEVPYIFKNQSSVLSNTWLNNQIVQKGYEEK